MKSMTLTFLTMFFFLLVGTANAATSSFSINGLKSIHSDTFCAEDEDKKKLLKKKKLEEEEEEEPECD